MTAWEQAEDLVPGDLVWCVFHIGGPMGCRNVKQVGEINVIVEVVSAHEDGSYEVVTHHDNSVFWVHQHQLYKKRIR